MEGWLYLTHLVTRCVPTPWGLCALSAGFSPVAKCGSVCSLLAITPVLIALSLENSIVSLIH